jgi:hypothetical protein
MLLPVSATTPHQVNGETKKRLPQYGRSDSPPPKWVTVEHDVSVNDVRIALTLACERQPQITLEEWINQSEFWSQPDKVAYTEGIHGKTLTRHIRPDGYAYLVTGHKHYRLLWEIDRCTEDNRRWVREKVYPYLTYLKSDAYEKRFGHNGGWILTVTTGERRVQNMKVQTERAVGKAARAFFFTTFDRLTAETVLTTPIWWRGGEEHPIQLLPP